MKFASNEDWVPGSKAVFTKFEGYKPREEAAGLVRLAASTCIFDRVEWNIITDACNRRRCAAKR